MLDVFKVPADKMKHLRVGVVLALVMLVMLALWQPWIAVGAGGTGACYFVEWYQRERGAGTFDLADLAFGAAPSWLAALLVAWLL